MRAAIGVENWQTIASQSSAVGRRLITDFPETLTENIRAKVSEALSLYGQASNLIWLIGSTHSALRRDQIQKDLSSADKLYQQSNLVMIEALAKAPEVIRLLHGQRIWVSRLEVPFRSAALVLYRQKGAGSRPEFTTKSIDLRNGSTQRIDFGNVEDFFCLIELHDAMSSGHLTLDLVSDSASVGQLDLTLDIPEQFPVSIAIIDETGRPTEAAAALYSGAGRLLVPATALGFSAAGYEYRPVRYRDHGSSPYWPGGAQQTRCFFVRGGFVINLPSGTYKLMSTKGPEYKGVNKSVTVSAGALNTERIQLKRWIDMPQRGWQSGDCHVHYARSSPAANSDLALWAKAEDLHMVNILRMGDAREVYFEQYAFGLRGRSFFLDGALVPGQEDPRTGVLGHTISLNLRTPIRRSESYYVYSDVFDRAHQQGGITGYAHVRDDEFLVHRDMTVDIPRNKVSFVEIAQFGDVGTTLYYEFLNLGFRLTAVGGSDAPWGGTIGDSRVYVYTGPHFDADGWFRGLKAGRTFVSVGPVLEFSVDGHMPGDQFTPAKGDLLRIHARAADRSGAQSLGQLEIIANGRVVRAVQADNGIASAEFELPADQSMWIAARAQREGNSSSCLAHTTPVYVAVQSKRWWDLNDVPRLLEKRFATLNELDTLIDRTEDRIPPGHSAELENIDAFRNSTDSLRKAIREARLVYSQLKELAGEQAGQGH